MTIYKVIGQEFNPYEGGYMENVTSLFTTKKEAEEYLKNKLNSITDYIESISGEIGKSSIEINETKHINSQILHTARVVFRPFTKDVPNDKGEPVYHYDKMTAELVLWFSGMGDYKCDKMTSTRKSDIDLLYLSLTEIDMF